MFPVSVDSAARILLQQAVQVPLPLAEEQHVEFLNALMTGGPISAPVKSEADARTQLLKIYPKDFVEHVSNLDIGDELRAFSLVDANERAFFSDWFSIRDFKEGGYARINEALRRPDAIPAELRPVIAHLVRSLMHLAMFQDAMFVEDIVYRGEIRNGADIAHLDEGEIYVANAFMSAFDDEEDVTALLADQAPLLPGEIRVQYEIERTTALAGPRITDLLRDGGAEVVFLPGTKFVVTGVERNSGQQATLIKLRTLGIELATWQDRLTSLVTSGSLAST